MVDCGLDRIVEAREGARARETLLEWRVDATEAPPTLPPAVDPAFEAVPFLDREPDRFPLALSFLLPRLLSVADPPERRLMSPTFSTSMSLNSDVTREAIMIRGDATSTSITNLPGFCCAGVASSTHGYGIALLAKWIPDSMALGCTMQSIGACSCPDTPLLRFDSRLVVGGAGDCSPFMINPASGPRHVAVGLKSIPRTLTCITVEG